MMLVNLLYVCPILSKQSKLYFYNFTQSTRPALLFHVFHLYTVTMVGVHTQPEVSHNKVSVYTNTLYEPKAHASDYMPGFRQFLSYSSHHWQGMTLIWESQSLEHYNVKRVFQQVTFFYTWQSDWTQCVCISSRAVWISYILFLLKVPNKISNKTLLQQSHRHTNSLSSACLHDLWYIVVNAGRLG